MFISMSRWIKRYVYFNVEVDQTVCLFQCRGGSSGTFISMLRWIKRYVYFNVEVDQTVCLFPC